jgi:cell division protein FtsW (lipid II flippase)
MNDFGTALIFFVAFLLIAYMRSGSVGTIALACTSLGFAGVLALKIAPHALRRFTSWRHIWENPLTTGYQQTRALMCIASGGLFGLGAGRGWMRHVFAADSDVVFASLCEEWGLLICVMLVLCVIVFALFALRCAAVGRSGFYTIGACTASGILLVQTILNVLGTVDVLPLTGVTFPFVSNGGSSMMCALGLLAFVKAADTRQNASFAVRQSKEGRQEVE